MFVVRVLWLTTLAILCGQLADPSRSLVAKEIFVNNMQGNDGNDGLSPEAVSNFGGPVLTIRRGLQLLDRSDTLVIANTGVPYYEALAFVGSRNSGASPELPLRIRGNGAVLSGLRQLPSHAWQLAGQGDGLWKTRLTRKGFYQILREGAPVPMTRISSPEELPAGHWMNWKGELWFKQDSETSPGNQDFSYAAEDVGLTFHRAESVLIDDLTVSHFRVDGVHAQQTCANLMFRNCQFLGNGRAGVAATGSVSLFLDQCQIRDNRLHSQVITGRARIYLEDCSIEGDELRLSSAGIPLRAD